MENIILCQSFKIPIINTIALHVRTLIAIPPKQTLKQISFYILEDECLQLGGYFLGSETKLSSDFQIASWQFSKFESFVRNIFSFRKIFLVATIPSTRNNKKVKIDQRVSTSHTMYITARACKILDHPTTVRDPIYLKKYTHPKRLKSNMILSDFSVQSINFAGNCEKSDVCFRNMSSTVGPQWGTPSFPEFYLH